jgi:hypothetical protein
MSDQIKVREISPFFITWIFINKNCFMKQIFEILQEERDRILNIHESATKNQYLNTLIVEGEQTELITEEAKGEYVTKQFNKFYVGNYDIAAGIAKGVKFVPSKNTVGYLVANPKTIYRTNGIGKMVAKPGEFVQYSCSHGKFRVGKDGGMALWNEALSKALRPLCAETKRTNNTKQVETPKPEEVDALNKKNNLLQKGSQFDADSKKLRNSRVSVINKPNDTALDQILAKIKTPNPEVKPPAPQKWEG